MKDDQELKIQNLEEENRALKADIEALARRLRVTQPLWAILKESTSKRNLPVEPEQGKPQKRRRSIRDVFKGGKNHK